MEPGGKICPERQKLRGTQDLSKVIQRHPSPFQGSWLLALTPGWKGGKFGGDGGGGQSGTKLLMKMSSKTQTSPFILSQWPLGLWLNFWTSVLSESA